MKWSRPQYTYLLIVLSLIVSCGLQVMWLRQLFYAQQKQLKNDIEQMLGKIAQTNLYTSVARFENPGNLKQIRQLFLSPQWEFMRQAMENTKMEGMSTSTSMNFSDDSTVVDLTFTLKDSIVKPTRKPRTSETGLTEEQLEEHGRISLREMQQRVDSALKQMGYRSTVYYNIYMHDRTTIYTSNVPKNLRPAYVSSKYLYNIQNIYRYELVLDQVNGMVWYRMKYYLVSSILMVLLTCTAFYFILRLLRNQKLYADARADFTSNMTHEFKTPIATVSVALESVQKYNLVNQPETLKKYLDISRQELRRLDHMVEKVLNISSGGDADQPLKTELFDVQQGLDQVIGSMQVRLANGKGVILFHRSEEPCFVNGDPFHLTNVFYNLVDNAIKYSGKDLLLDISCNGDAENVVIRFKDNGPGIAPEYQKKIFERFYRVPVQGSTHDVKGSGLGLDYVKEMIEKHQGSIRLKSEAGHGAEFTLTLPSAT